MPEEIRILPRKLLLREKSRPDRVVNVVVQIGDLIRKADRLSFQGRRLPGGAVVQDPVPHLLREV